VQNFFSSRSPSCASSQIRSGPLSGPLGFGSERF
jgi:uncharacterized protein YbbK (DUF523 family)